MLTLTPYELGVSLAGSFEVNQKASNPAHALAKKTKRLVRIGIMHNDSALVTLDAYPRSQPLYLANSGPALLCIARRWVKHFSPFWSTKKIEAYLERVELTSFTPNTITQKDQLRRELDKTRKRGYSINREEHFMARPAIGAPILGRKGNPDASIVLVLNPSQMTGQQIGKLSKEVMKTASEISHLMGFSLPSFLLRK